MIIHRSDFPVFMTPKGMNGLRILFDQTEGLLPDQRGELFRVKDTDNPFEQSIGTVGIGLVPRKPEANPVRFDAPRQGRPVTYVFPTYSLATAISREAQEDDKTNQLVPMITRELKWAMSETMEQNAFDILNDGFTLQGYEPDGVPLFSENHPLLRIAPDGATDWSNMAASGGTALGITSLESARATMLQTRNDSGRFTAKNPATLWVHTSKLALAEKIVGTPQVLGSNDNDKNLFYRNLVVKATPRIENPDAWFLQAGGTNPFVWWNRRPARMETDLDLISAVTILIISARWGRGFDDPRGWFGSDGAA
jgi:hypothetical protein